MTSDRQALFDRLRAALEPRPNRAPYPDYDDQIATAAPRLVGDSLWEDFARNFQAAHGRPMTDVASLLAFLKSENAAVGYCDPALKSSIGDRCAQSGMTVHYVYERDRYDDYQFGITRASGAIAETGSLVLTDLDTSDRLGALTPWIHIAVLEAGLLLRSLADAIAAFGEHGNIIWATGPSKTADVEGILIEGVHGPGQQICLKLGD